MPRRGLSSAWRFIWSVTETLGFRPVFCARHSRGQRHDSCRCTPAASAGLEHSCVRAADTHKGLQGCPWRPLVSRRRLAGGDLLCGAFFGIVSQNTAGRRVPAPCLWSLDLTIPGRNMTSIARIRRLHTPAPAGWNQIRFLCPIPEDDPGSLTGFLGDRLWGMGHGCRA